MRRLITIFIASALVASACGASAGIADSEESEAVTSTTESPEVVEETTTTVSEEVEETAPPTSKALAPVEQIRILYPETLGFSAPFTMMDTSGNLSGVANIVELNTWATPDVMRAALLGGDVEFTAVPTNVGANLYNKGVDVQMMAVVVWGLLWMIGPEGTEPDWESLRGETVMMLFPNDMPDLVFQYLAAANGLVVGEDFEIEYYAQGPEVVGRLVNGSGQWAVLPEHVATVALAQAGKNGQSLDRLFDLQAEWADAAGTSPRIPQAGIVVSRSLAAECPDVIAAMFDELENAAALVNEASPETVGTLSEASGVPGPIVEQVIPRLNIEIVAAGDAQDELEKFFTELASLLSEINGGSLPDDDFYLDDPR